MGFLGFRVLGFREVFLCLGFRGLGGVKGFLGLGLSGVSRSGGFGSGWLSMGCFCGWFGKIWFSGVAGGFLGTFFGMYGSKDLKQNRLPKVTNLEDMGGEILGGSANPTWKESTEGV